MADAIINVIRVIPETGLEPTIAIALAATVVNRTTVGGVMLVLNQVYGFSGENALGAPQANAMAKVIEPR